MQHPNYYGNIVRVSTRLGNFTSIPGARFNGQRHLDKTPQNTQDKFINSKYSEEMLNSATNIKFKNYKSSLEDVNIERGKENSRRHSTRRNSSFRKSGPAESYVRKLHRLSKRFSHKAHKKQWKLNRKSSMIKKKFRNDSKITYNEFPENNKKHVKSNYSKNVTSKQTEFKRNENTFVNFVFSTEKPRLENNNNAFKLVTNKTANVKKSTNGFQQGSSSNSGRSKEKEFINQQPNDAKQNEKSFIPLNDFKYHERDINTIYDIESQNNKSKIDVQHLSTLNQPMYNTTFNAEQNTYVKGDERKLKIFSNSKSSHSFGPWNTRILSKKAINDSLEIIQKLEHILKILQSYNESLEHSTINRLPRITSDTMVKNSNVNTTSQVKTINNRAPIPWKWVVVLLLFVIFMTILMCFYFDNNKRISQMFKYKNSAEIDSYGDNYDYDISDVDSGDVLFDVSDLENSSRST